MPGIHLCVVAASIVGYRL